MISLKISMAILSNVLDFKVSIKKKDGCDVQSSPKKHK